MIARPFWRDRIESGWRKASIVWLSGVRRVGKTTLAEALEDAAFLNCDLPSSQQLLADPEAFYRSLDKPRLILDEVHQLSDPSRLLKIGADAFPKLKILATGSSTLAATHKFRDSLALAGRKRNVHLVPLRFRHWGRGSRRVGVAFEGIRPGRAGSGVPFGLWDRGGAGANACGGCVVTTDEDVATAAHSEESSREGSGGGGARTAQGGRGFTRGLRKLSSIWRILDKARRRASGSSSRTRRVKVSSGTWA